MQFVSVQFLIFVALSLSAFHLSGSLRAKKVVLLASNLVFALFLVESPRRMLPMALFLAGSFCLVRLVQARRRRSLLLMSVVLTLGAFVYLKQYNLPSAFPVLREPYSVIGLSYVLFRVLHLMIDSHEGMLPETVSPVAFFNYCCFFPAWLSGPIQRYEDYREQERTVGSVELSTAQVYEALSRIVTGVFKIAVLSAVLFEVHRQLGGLRLEGSHPLHFVVTLAAAASLYTLFMYYNFSGYMDVAIGVAALYGFRLPENFDRPFAAGNLLEFWTRWHITLSAWFRTYLFNPLLRTLVARFGTARSGPYLGVAAYLITFSVMGIWHGSTPVFVVYGLLLGVSVSANKLYEIEARRWLGKDAFRRLRANALYCALCRGLVFASFAGALICFWAAPRVTQRLLESPLLVAASYLGLTIAAAAILTLASLMRAGWESASARFQATSQSALARQAVLGVKTYAVVLLLVMQWTTVPSFVYVPF